MTTNLNGINDLTYINNKKRFYYSEKRMNCNGIYTAIAMITWVNKNVIFENKNI